MTDTDKLKRLAEAATAYSYKGWTYQPPSDPMCAGRVVGSEHGPVLVTVQWPVPMMDHVLAGVDSSRTVGAFIAAANPATILALLAENERLEELYDLTGRQCDGWMSRAKSAEKQRDKAMQSVSIWIEEHDRIKFQRDEAVALLRVVEEKLQVIHGFNQVSGRNKITRFLARIDAANNTVA